MKFQFNHNNINVRDLDRSLAFYRDALGLTEDRKPRTARSSSFSSATAFRRTVSS